MVVQRMFLRARNVLTIAALAAGTWISAASAQAQQSNVRAGPTEWFRDDAGNANGGGTAPVAPGDVPPAPPANAGGGNGNVPVVPNVRPYRMPPMGGYGGNGYGSVSGLYPSAEMNNYATAMARAATARALFHQADSELGQAYRAAQRQFDNSQEYKQAIKEERDAFDGLNAARTKALMSLNDDQKYQRLLALRQDLSERLDEPRMRRSLTPDEVVAMASLKMSYATEMRAIEATALEKEPTVRSAQDRLVAAGARVSELRQRYADSLRVNPDVLMARRNLEDARIAKLTAEAYLHAAMVNGSYALDYAYYLYRRPGSYGNYYGNDPYSYTGYGNYRY